jgi:hypothetical protein
MGNANQPRFALEGTKLERDELSSQHKVIYCTDGPGEDRNIGGRTRKWPSDLDFFCVNVKFQTYSRSSSQIGSVLSGIDLFECSWLSSEISCCVCFRYWIVTWISFLIGVSFTDSSFLEMLLTSFSPCQFGTYACQKHTETLMTAVSERFSRTTDLNIIFACCLVTMVGKRYYGAIQQWDVFVSSMEVMWRPGVSPLARALSCNVIQMTSLFHD